MKKTVSTFSIDGSVKHSGATDLECPDAGVMKALNAGITPTARVIITLDCNRTCVGCCNSFPSTLQHATKISFPELVTLKKHLNIVLTGGEPLLKPQWLNQIIYFIKNTCPDSKIYLYTAMWSDFLPEIISKINGLTYTLHTNETTKDIADLGLLQDYIHSSLMKKYRPDLVSYRLYVDPRVSSKITIIPNLWERVRFDPWMSEEELKVKCPDGVPTYETLYLLQEQG
jgi:hypothetical protein